jgi:hypothetical protein
MKTKIIILLIYIGNVVHCQDNQQNLRKYWYYRERLKKFVLVSSNYNENGTNIPGSDINLTKDLLSWDDGNGALNQYISMLATEYGLFKKFGNTTEAKNTASQLYYAIKSFERLDRIAEAIKDPNHVQQTSDLNGFFLRNDMNVNNESSWNKYKYGGSSAYFDQPNYFIGIPNEENSLDNCIHLIESFTLVNALVDNEIIDGIVVNFKQLAKDNINRMIQNMQHYNAPIPQYICLGGSLVDICLTPFSYTWYVSNPLTNTLSQEGNGTDFTMLYASYGFSEAANKILGMVLFNGITNYSDDLFKILLTYPLADVSIKLTIYQKMAAITGAIYTDVELKINTPYTSDKVFDLVPDEPKIWVPNPFFPFVNIEVDAYAILAENSKTWKLDYDDYKIRSLSSTGNISDYNGLSSPESLLKKQNFYTVLKYEHLPLIWAVNNKNFGYINSEEKNYIKNLLNTAPVCGPYYKSSTDNGGIWSSVSHLIWPEKNGNGTGYFNGLDYMLLHNLYWLTNFQYPTNVNYIQTSGLPLQAIATNQVSCSSNVSCTNGPIVLMAANRVILSPGFIVTPTNANNFIATSFAGMYADNSGLIFQKVSLDNYQDCSGFLKSTNLKQVQEINYKEPDADIIIYPNPCKDFITLEVTDNSKIKTIEIYDKIGVLQLKIKITDNSPQFDLSSLASGVYLIKVTFASDIIRMSRITKL